MEDALCLDLRGLKCPLPALMARRRLARLAAGVHLTVLADDPLAAVDIPHMCNEEGHDVIAVNKQDGHYAFAIRRAPPGQATGDSTPAGGPA
jgi:tRNA 2-thiouridine synthesizing protein A